MKSDKKIIIVEPSPIVSAGLVSYFDDINQVSIVSQLDRIDRMEEKLAAYNPDILIINPLLIAYDTNEHFLKICRDFSNVIPVALVTSYVDAGILKQFKDVIEINDSKQKVVTKIFNLLSDNNLTQDKPENIELSNRETDVLVALVKGLTNKEISDKLYISVHTVITHRKNIVRKTGIKSVSGLTVYALLNNLVDESEIYK
ncbi:MAG: response regulator transcription factor [Bacteroidales bacterium]|nr:response regulator transcription factor [Bacteroidales bacterium]MBR6437945.1 response regulator transcription factor [Bacteroidales bacterium]